MVGDGDGGICTFFVLVEPQTSEPAQAMHDGDVMRIMLVENQPDDGDRYRDRDRGGDGDGDGDADGDGRVNGDDHSIPCCGGCGDGDGDEDESLHAVLW